MKKRVNLLLIAVMVLALFLTACQKTEPDTVTEPDGQTETQTETETEEDVEKVVTVIAEMGTLNMDPVSGALSMSQQVKHNIYNTLVKYDGEYNIMPSLAESWVEDADGVTVTFKLREGVKFHNGEDFTADDVVFSHEQLLTSPIGAGLPMMIASIEKVDDYTVKVVKAASYVNIFDVLINFFVVIPQDYVTENPEGLVAAPIGTGAYKFVKQDADGAIFLEANPDYFFGQPEVDTYIVRVPMEESSTTIALESGEVDLVVRYSTTQRIIAEGIESIDLYKEFAFGATSVMFSGEPFVSNKALREAVYHALDTEALMILSNGDGELINDFFSPKIMGDAAGYLDISGSYDVELAKQKLAESGYDTSQPIVIATLAAGAPLIQAMQGQLGAIGLTVDIDQVDMNVYYDKMMKGELSMVVSSLGGISPGLVDIMSAFTTAGDYMRLNGEKSPEFDAIMDKVKAETDPDARLELAKEALDVFAEMYNVVTIYNPYSCIAYNPRIEGVHGASSEIIYAEDLDVK